MPLDRSGEGFSCLSGKGGPLPFSLHVNTPPSPIQTFRQNRQSPSMKDSEFQSSRTRNSSRCYLVLPGWMRSITVCGEGSIRARIALSFALAPQAIEREKTEQDGVPTSQSRHKEEEKEEGGRLLGRFSLRYCMIVGGGAWVFRVLSSFLLGWSQQQVASLLLEEEESRRRPMKGGGGGGGGEHAIIPHLRSLWTRSHTNDPLSRLMSVCVGQGGSLGSPIIAPHAWLTPHPSHGEGSLPGARSS